MLINVTDLFFCMLLIYFMYRNPILGKKIIKKRLKIDGKHFFLSELIRIN